MSTTGLTSAGRRIDALLDEGSFVEIGGSVTARSTDFNLTAKKQPEDGVITGYGTINSGLVYVYSQDASVLGGSMGEMHAKKIMGIYKMAMKMGAPIIGMIDCAGLRLQEATDALNAFGELFAAQIDASGVVPQITAVFGNCGGGMALVPALTDFTFMEKDKAKLFVNSPNALDGNRTEKCDTASAAFQSAEAGNVDFVGSEDEIIAAIRDLIGFIPENCDDEALYASGEDDINRLVDGVENGAGDAVYVLQTIADDSDLFELKADHAKEMVTGFIKLGGQTVGCIANRSIVTDEEGKEEKLDTRLTVQGLEKAAGFARFCDAFNIPILTLSSATGFKTDVCSEKRMARAAASLVKTIADATVPKVNLVTGNAFGTAYLIMNSKSLGADLSFAWPDTSVSVMDAQSAAKIIYADEIAKSDDPVAVINEKAKEYALLSASAASAASRGYIDSIIDPAQTRKHLVAAFEMLYTKKEEKPAKKHSAVL
ncbi:MAG: carboxyl transferase [Lachnospiraceae bacterium]|nr:carboxyl transferase [Lachnospiraceae bacterium]